MNDDTGVNPVPNETELKEWLWVRLHEATSNAELISKEFDDVVNYGKEQDEPEIYAYARLLNHLAQLDTPALIRVLSAFVWHNNKGQN